MQHAGEAHETKRERIARPLRGVSRLLCALGALGVRVCLCVILCGSWQGRAMGRAMSVYVSQCVHTDTTSSFSVYVGNPN